MDSYTQSPVFAIAVAVGVVVALSVAVWSVVKTDEPRWATVRYALLAGLLGFSTLSVGAHCTEFMIDVVEAGPSMFPTRSLPPLD